MLVALNDTIYGARDVTKTSTFMTDTFQSPDFGALGYIQQDQAVFYRESTKRHTVDSEFDITNLHSLPAVDIIYGYANNSRIGLDAMVKAGSVGIVNAGTGNGSLSAGIKEGLVDAREQGVVIVRSSRTGSGIVARNGEADDDKLDFVAADTLNPQKARILLMLALTVTSDTKEIQRMFWEY